MFLLIAGGIKSGVGRCNWGGCGKGGRVVGCGGCVVEVEDCVCVVEEGVGNMGSCCVAEDGCCGVWVWGGVVGSGLR
ncbi:MAG: hypothetical protein K6347_08320 [Campylobacterales bacterium]